MKTIIALTLIALFGVAGSYAVTVTIGPLFSWCDDFPFGGHIEVGACR